MTDQIPADKVREILATRGLWPSAMIAEIEALLPPPPRPTLADMTPEERDDCQWMQADVKGRLDRWAITRPFGEGGDVETVSESGQTSWFPPGHVTPRPDLPRMTWPGDKKAEDVAPTKVGDVIESAADPRLAALPTGSALLDCDGEAVAKRGEVWVGDGYIPIPEEGGEFGPWTVLHISKGADQ